MTIQVGPESQDLLPTMNTNTEAAKLKDTIHTEGEETRGECPGGQRSRSKNEALAARGGERCPRMAVIVTKDL